MNQDNVTISSLDPNTFEYQTYSNADSELIVQSQLDTVFSKDTDYIEYYAFDQSQNLIYPGATIPLLDYDVRDGDILLDPQKDLIDTGYDLGTYTILYNFYRKRLSSDIAQKYFISDISSDRTEVRLDSNIISNELIISSSNSFVQYRENAEYFVDFYLNFGLNQTVIANNLKLETEEGIDPTVLVKLYEPLPSNFNVKDELWVVEELSTSQAYKLNFPFEPIIEDDFTYISGPNYNLNITQETSTGGELFSFDTLLQSNVTSSINQIQNLLNQKEIDINVNYENYANFIHFSSAKIRLENFYYKVGLIESASNQITDDLDLITSQTANTTAFSSSKAQLTGQINSIIKNFDGYESFLYFNSGSQYSYPKQTSQPPFELYSTGSTEVLEWIGNATVGETYYGGQALSASDYDQNNKNWLYWAIPEYLRDDPANEGYELFVDMVAQYYDNVWVYTKDISNKFDADNRLEYGIAKDLVADAIRDFGVKLYASNFNTNDLFTAFLGITPSGSAFPFPYMTGSIGGGVNTPTGYEYVDTEISASNDIVPLNNVQKQVYKRIYHNIPYLLKTKGTIAGIRALITSYGIPDTILRISEFGGKDRNESQDYDLKQNVFNYAFDTGDSATKYVSSSFDANSNFGNTSPNSVQFRFKSAGIPTASNNTPSSDIRYSQSLFIAGQGDSAIVLEYTGSGLVSGSYSGSVVSPYDIYGTLKFIPNASIPDKSASIYLPFFNKDWWSVQVNVNEDTPSATLFAANEINGKVGFSGSDQTTNFDVSYWNDSTKAFLNTQSDFTPTGAGGIYQPFSGSFQELRYWNVELSESKFFDYTVNPYSNEGNTINSTPDELFFRAALGSQLSRDRTTLALPNNIPPTSIHPRVTGSAVQITQSFQNGTSDYFIPLPLSRDEKLYVENKEFIYQDQVPAGIKNRITDKIYNENLILAEAPYGFQTPTSSQATISSTTSDVISPIESIQQQSFVSQSYTPNVNYLEVAFSPSNQINDDINAQLGYFNLGDYIGDPRFISSSLDSYPDLDRLRNAYFEKYIKGYDIVDFIRLIKFFDNSLFKMIKDFTPARTSLASGVVVKQHLLERNRLRPAQVTSSLHDYEGLVVNLPKNYSSGSSDFPQYSTSGSSIYKFSGGTGGSFENYNSITTYQSGSKGLGPDNRFFLTQSWSESFDYGAIDRSVINSLLFNQSSSQFISASYKGIRYGQTHNDQSEFYNGIFSGSFIEVTDQVLNPDCEPYLKVTDQGAIYKPIYFGFDNSTDGAVTPETFVDPTNIPPKGYIWIGSSLDNPDNLYLNSPSTVKFIKVANEDINGLEVGEYLSQGSTIVVGTSKYLIEGVVNYGSHVLLNVVNRALDANITITNNGGQEDFTLDNATGSYSQSGTSDLTSQGYFHDPVINASQNIYFFGDQEGNTSANTVGINPQIDVLSAFNPGEKDVTSLDILNNPTLYKGYGGYNIIKTPNTPFYFSCSINYSASELGFSNVITSSGLYHDGNANPSSTVAYDHQFKMSNQSIVDYTMSVYRPSPTSVELQNTQFVEDLNANFYNINLPGGSASWYDNSITLTPGNGPAEYPQYAPSTPAQAAKPNETILPGHPQFKNPGTSSFDWYFPTLTFNQTSTPIPDLSTSPTSLSGSTTYLPNENFQFDLGGISYTSDNIYNSTTDGSVGMSFKWLASQINTLSGGFSGIGGSTPLDPPTGNIQVHQIIVQYEIEAAPGTNLSCSVYGLAQDGGSSTGNRLTNFSTGIGSMGGGAQYEGQYFDQSTATPSGAYVRGDSGLNGVSWMTENTNIPGKWQVTASSSPADFDTFFGASLINQSNSGIYNTTNWMFVKPVVKGEDAPSTTYKIKNYRMDFRIVYQTSGNNSFDTLTTGDVGQGFSWTKDPNVNGNTPPFFASYQGTSTNPTNQQVILPTNANLRVGATVDITPRLMRLSGSADSTTGNSPNIPQLITQSATVNYTLTPGEGTSGGGGGGRGGGVSPTSTLTSFTETVDFSSYSPILDILHPYHGNNGDGSVNWPVKPLGNGSTIINQDDTGSIFYIEYSMSNYSHPQSSYSTTFNWNNSDGSNEALSNNIDSGTKLIVSHSVEGNFTGTDFVTASIFITKTTPSSNAMGQTVAFQDVLSTTSMTDTGVATMSGSLNLNTNDYKIGDTFRMGVAVNKSFNYGLDIIGYSMSIYNSSSQWALYDDASRMSNGNLLNEANNFKQPINTVLIIPTFVADNVLPFQFATDCQPLLNNFVNQRVNGFLMDIDYNWQGTSTYYSSSLAPVNFIQILSGSAVRASVPESNYTTARSANPRYKGSKSTSQQLNVWNIGDTGTFGKLPTVELRDAFFGYFNDLDDPYPNINNLTRVNLNYLIDEEGNALPPSLDQLSIDTFESVFPDSTLAKIAPKSGKNNFKVLGSPAPISRLMQYVTPIMYSQNAGNNYTNVIPLSGSGYISRYDNDDESAQVFSRFNALGEASVTTTSPVQSVDFMLNPPLPTAQPAIPGNTFNPWSRNGTYGAAVYPESQYSSLNYSEGDDLPNEQIVTVDASIVTSFVSETRRTRDELQFEFHMYTGSIDNDYTQGPSLDTEQPFNLEDITCTVYTTDGRVRDLGSVLDYGWFQMINIVDYERVKRKDFKGLSWRRNRWRWSYVPVPTGGIKCSVDWEMYNTLYDLGLYRSSLYEIAALEWNIKANSGNHTIKVGDQISWRYKGFFKNAKSGYRQGLFFPLDFEGQYTSVMVEGVGAYDHLLSQANTASAPYWVFTGSSGTSFPSIKDQQFLVMSSSNMNEAYGQSFRQADLEYFPSPSEYFPGGIEPKTTRFDNIEYPLEIKIGDEIRFGNNENFTYKISEVFPPQNNNGTYDRANRLKIKLDKPVDGSINKDFFLVRRPIVNPNSLYLEQPFPYDSLASASISTIIKSTGSFALTGSTTPGQVDGLFTGSLSSLEIADTPGILYPDFPTEYLVKSASVIVNDLISKGIIES